MEKILRPWCSLGPVGVEKPLFFEHLTRLLGRDISSKCDVLQLVKDGLPTDIIQHLAEQGLTKKELNFISPPRTLSRRIQNGHNLTTEESERAMRIVCLLVKAAIVWGDTSVAVEWLRLPTRKYNGKSPLEIAITEQGARLVEELLDQVVEGYCA